MESNQDHSVVDLVKCPVRSAHVKRSQVCGPVSNKPFTDFSIRRILGLENEDTDNSSLPERRNTTNSSFSPSSDSASSDVSHRQASPVLTPYSDITSSSNETDGVPNATEKLRKKG
ncbi:PREDICTED: uncharacterized protein LOC107356078 [Acropora digitifera]|uniref:uncharacterized protein LOC107356078 n=1 Tax=Acropora digitifera TaxID=70779 RepID=UPI00077AE3F0|nr:PREDICTED: uncharacterized protein LOC107356078 [Acropora digitifera]